MEESTKSQTAKRDRTMRFRATEEEAREIEQRAASTGMGVSGYVRAAALNHPVRSVYDLKAVAELGRINGDLGWVAGLLKLWLAERRGQGAPATDVERMMSEFRTLQTELSRMMRQALK